MKRQYLTIVLFWILCLQCCWTQVVLESLWHTVYIYENSLTAAGVTTQNIGKMSLMACSIKAVSAASNLFCHIDNDCHISSRVVVPMGDSIVSASDRIQCYTRLEGYEGNASIIKELYGIIKIY